jgi:hypothetical protein
MNERPDLSQPQPGEAARIRAAILDAVTDEGYLDVSRIDSGDREAAERALEAMLVEGVNTTGYDDDVLQIWREELAAYEAAHDGPSL